MTITTLYIVIAIAGAVAGLSTRTNMKYSLGVTFGIACLGISIIAGMNYAVIHSLGIMGAGILSYVIFYVIINLIGKDPKEVAASTKKEYQFKANQPSKKKKRK